MDTADVRAVTYWWPAVDHGGELSPFPMANAVLRRWRLFVILPLLLALALVVPRFFAPRVYESTASFTPQAGGVPRGAISGLAAQFGLSVPAGEATQSPAFYADLLTSRELLTQVATTRFEFPTDSGPLAGTLVELLQASGETEALRLDNAYTAIERRTRIGIGLKTGTVELAFDTPWPALSQQVVTRMLDLLNEFNLERRQSQAAAERRFVEQRLAEVKAELRAAEERLEAFQAANRVIGGSATLRLQEERLQRAVLERQQVATTLAQAFEQARVDEVRDTPVITVVERPSLAARPRRRGLLLRLIVTLFSGVVIAGVITAVAEGLQRAGARDRRGLEEFRALRRQLPWPLRGRAPSLEEVEGA